MRTRLPTTLRLAGLAFLFAVLIGVPLGVLGAARTRDGRRRYSELGFTATTGAFASIPSFLLAVALIYLFGIKWRVLPVAGEGGVPTYVLPIAALAIGPAFALARIVRVEGLKVLEEDYIRTARGKRLSARLIYLRHALPNMLTATLTISGLLLGGLIAGTVLIEYIFAWTGLGSTLVSARRRQGLSGGSGGRARLWLLHPGDQLRRRHAARDHQPAVDDPRPVTGRRFARWPDLFRSPVGVVAALMVGGFLLLAIVAPPLWSHAASKIDISAVSQGSTAAHPLGTDVLGRDILHRTLVAARLSVLLAVLASVLGARLASRSGSCRRWSVAGSDG